jgi:hypothetical protein
VCVCVCERPRVRVGVCVLMRGLRETAEREAQGLFSLNVQNSMCST